MAISLNVSVPSAIPDVDTLIATVSDWLDRDDLNAKIPTFILFAEAMFNRELRTTQMERSSTVSVTSEDTPLPSDYIAMRSIYEEGSPDLPLRGIAPSAIRQGFDGTAGTPVAYALVSQSIRLVPPPASELMLTMDYWGRLDGLSTVTPSNWLLETHPDAYLYGTLYFAEQMLDNATRVGQWKQLLDEVVQRINRSSKNDRYGAGPLVPNTVSQVRGSRC